MKNHLFLLACLSSCLSVAQPVPTTDTPLDVIKRIGDKLIRDTPFSYRLVRATPSTTFDGLQAIDFGRTFTLCKPAVAYAYTRLTAPGNQTRTLQVEHNDGCKIWLNGQLVYEKKGNHAINIVHDERSIELPNVLKLTLHKGANDLLIKSETAGKDWRVYLQPPSTKGAVLTSEQAPLTIGLHGLDSVDSSVADLSNWLVIGPFANPASGATRTGLDKANGPETGIQFGTMYGGLEAPVTWTIPKVDVLGDVYNPLTWGTNYNWNYHNGGVAWAMQQLAEQTGEKKYDDFASRFCDFQLASIPFVRYQVKTLNAVNSANYQLVDTPLLDFTLAPALPFIYRLRKNQSFANRTDYESFIANMIKYARFEQIRLPGSGIYTRTTPEKYTTWADDMFMGIPFLVQAAQYTPDATTRKAILDDAASQVLGFTKQVWDPAANLYMHARYSNRDVKLPHWTRANGWAIWATSEVLVALPNDHPQYQSILNQYRKHVQSLVRYQTEAGFWPNVMDRPDGKIEVSGTAILTMAMARGITHGWIDAQQYKPIVVKGWNALKTQVDADGTVHNICMGTMCSEDVNYYLNRPYFDNDTHGLFAVLFAALEVNQMLAGDLQRLKGR
ncbi:glycoside hydrolase family 88 protein (plasmid) [Spirosoma sp. SC4-14]|uniref:glycoside hydrolase family 88/105 protein n=1 Tax=Spirosoma sp. SC4-14 TaxID=3128900 RepID=UPI0030D15D28